MKVQIIIGTLNDVDPFGLLCGFISHRHLLRCIIVDQKSADMSQAKDVGLTDTSKRGQAEGSFV
jgi:hypothetical protein